MNSQNLFVNAKSHHVQMGKIVFFFLITVPNPNKKKISFILFVFVLVSVTDDVGKRASFLQFPKS